jgi:hypothetical protein
VNARDISWSQVTAKADFSPRTWFSSEVFNDRIWVIGGLENTGTVKSDVWLSADGETWDLVTGSAGFTPRYGHSTVIHDGKIWVIGGYDIGHNFKNDVWFSEDGKNWKQATPKASFMPRLGHTSIVYNNRIWVIGGEIRERPWVYTNDIWYSSDGISWYQATPSADFFPRIGHETILSNDKMLVIGGVGDELGKVRFNDVWSSSNGIAWKKEVDHAAFPSRYYIASGGTSGNHFIIGGFNGTSALNETWSSEDGRTWVLDTSNDCFSPRYGHRAVYFKNSIWVIGGTDYNNNYFNDVWHSSAIGSPSPPSKLTVNKSVSPWSIKQGTDTRVTIMYTNDGNAPLHDIEIEDTYPDGFVLISGEPVMAVPQSLMPDESRIFDYTLRATKTGTFTFPKTSALYAGNDGNYHTVVSNAPVVTVLAPLFPEVETPGNEPESLFDGLWREITEFFSM